MVRLQPVEIFADANYKHLLFRDDDILACVACLMYRALELFLVQMLETGGSSGVSFFK